MNNGQKGKLLYAETLLGNIANLISGKLMPDHCTVGAYSPGTVSLPTIAGYGFSFKR